MRRELNYQTLERLRIGKPVDRIGFISECCSKKVVLDIGCFDETALQKRETEHWLHGRIISKATRVVGIDASNQVPNEGLTTDDHSIIVRGDGIDPCPAIVSLYPFETIVAGEFIEHIDSPLRFFNNMSRLFPGRELIISTPNGCSLANVLLGCIGREAQHRDHIQTFTYKILNTLCQRAGFADWEIIPYRFFATEMIMSTHGVRRVLVKTVERFVRLAERAFPLLSFGYIVRIRIWG